MQTEDMTTLVRGIEQLLRNQQALQRNLQASIPKYLTKEYMNIVNDVTLNLAPQSHNLEKIHAIMAYTTSGPATLTLGRRVLTLAAGWTQFTSLELFLLPDDTRTLQQPVAGAMFLELQGQEMPTDGQGGTF